MELKMNNCERLGVNPKWTALKTIVSNLKKVDYDSHISHEITRIEDYITRRDIEGTIPNIRNITTDDPIVDIGRELCERQLIFAFQNQSWLEGMAAPFDKLPPEQPVPPLDDLMQAVLKRAREDWPHYDDVLSLEELKKPIDQITLYDMPVKLANTAGNKQAKGLLARLFGK